MPVSGGSQCNHKQNLCILEDWRAARDEVKASSMASILISSYKGSASVINNVLSGSKLRFVSSSGVGGLQSDHKRGPVESDFY